MCYFVHIFDMHKLSNPHHPYYRVMGAFLNYTWMSSVWYTFEVSYLSICRRVYEVDNK